MLFFKKHTLLSIMNLQEISDLRRERLATWFDAQIESKRFKNGKEICDYYAVPVLSITALLNSKRAIGEKTARELEQQFQLGHLFLDHSNSDVTSTELHRATKNKYFEMQRLGQGLFQLQVVCLESLTDLEVLSDEQYWLIVNGSDYAPILEDTWAVLCTADYNVHEWQLYVVKLITGACLILKLQDWNETEYRMRSLDGQRQLILLQADLAWMHAIIRIVPKAKK